MASDGGMTAGTGARARLVMGAAEWRDLGASGRAAAGRMLARHGVTWTALRDDAGATYAHRSSPLALADAVALRQQLATAHHLPGVRVLPVHTHAHLAAVMLGGRRVVMGSSAPMLSAADAETRGEPVAIVTRDGVLPYGAAVYGHTDAELMAARVLTREREVTT